MKSVEIHPSYLKLDRMVLGQVDRGVAEHVRGCERCRAHVEQLGSPGALPEAFRRLEAPPWWRRWRTWSFTRLLATPAGRPLAIASAAAAAGVSLVIALPGVAPEPPLPATLEPAYVAAKGLATVAVWVKHGDDIRLWDGVGAVAPGDRVQLEIEPGPHRWFAVLAGTESTRLVDGDLEPERRHLLPRSFIVDGEPGPETLVLVLSPTPLPNDRLAAAASGEVSEVKAIRLVIPKEPLPETIP